MQEIAASNYFGANWKDITLNPSDELLNSFEGKYTGIQSALEANEKRIESYEKEKEAIEELKQAWEDAKNAYQYAEYEKKLASYFGSDYEYQLLNNSKVWRQQYAQEYANLCTQIEELEQKIKAANDKTASAATTNAETIKTANEETVKSADALRQTVSGAEDVTNSVVDDAYNKVLTIQEIIVTLNHSIEYLKWNISLLYESLSKINEADISTLINSIGGTGSSGGSESGKEGGYSLPSFGGKSNSSESSGGAGSLLDAINAVMDAIGTEGNADQATLMGVLEGLNNKQLDTIISEFGTMGDDGASEGSLLSAINDVSYAIIGGGDSEFSLIDCLLRLDDADVVKPIDTLCNKFISLYDKLCSCIEKVETLSSKLEHIPTWKLAFLGTGTAFTFGTGTAFTSGNGTLGNAYSSGTGRWGLSSDKPGSLVGEIGSEIVVRNGKYKLISSPTLMDLKKGDIVFNHKQTEAILRNGKKSVIDGLSDKSKSVYTKLTGSAFAKGTMSENVFNAIMHGLQFAMNPIDTMPKFAHAINSVPEARNEQNFNVTIGDIYLNGVQDTNGLAKAIKDKLPRLMVQELSRR